MAIQYDTPIGVGGRIDTTTGKILSGAKAGTYAGQNDNAIGSTNSYSAPIPVSALTTQAPTPAKVIPPQVPTDSIGLSANIGAMAAQNQDQYNADLAAKTASTEQNKTDSFQQYLKSILESDGQTQLTANEYAATGVDKTGSELKAINNQILADQVATRHQIEQLKAENPMGLSTEAINSQIQDIQDKSTSRQADLAVTQLAKQGQYDSAKAIADRAVAAKMERQKTINDALKFNYEENKDLFTTAEKRQFETAQADRNRKLELDTYKEKARYDQIIKQSDPLYQAKLAKARSDATAGNINISNPSLAPALSTILASGKFTKEQAAQLAAGINSGQNPLAVVKNQAKNIMGQTEGTTVTKYEAAKTAMEGLQSSLAEYYANGGKSGIFTGNYEKTLNNLGTVQDPKLVDLATQIASQLQVYRNAVSGTAYSVQEGKEIGAVFPGITKSEGLNQAIISGRLKSFDSAIDATYGTVLGAKVYNDVKAAAGGKVGNDSKGYVEKVLSSKGVNYNNFVASAPPGQIPVVKNDDGQIGYILPGEFNSVSYTRI